MINPGMRALSIRQPWAWLIARGYKTSDFRSWHTRYTGRIYIHAAKTFDVEGYLRLLEGDYRWSGIASRLIDEAIKELRFQKEFVRGAIIAEVDLISCIFAPVQSHELFPKKKLLKKLYSYRKLYSLEVRNSVIYQEPIECAGKPNLFYPRLEKEEQQDVEADSCQIT